VKEKWLAEFLITKSRPKPYFVENIYCMDRKYWERIAPAYNDEIFDVLHNDKKAIIRSAIEKIAGPGKTVLDAGCAIGKWLPVLAPAFKKVIAADISAKNLEIAAKNFPGYINVNYLRADLSSPTIKLPKCDVTICINAILTDSMKKRNAFFKNLSSCTRKAGYLVLTVPALESWMFSRIIQQKWNIDKKYYSDKISGAMALKKYKNMIQGNMDLDHVPTKHYLKEELQLLLANEGFNTLDTQKIEYDWSTEFHQPPKWLKEPKPWDWMVLAQKK
jgi:2-polyprenyl-3-methyl-5-hydroxy-6-metoxy-1,4-benzoquinol methylase